MVKRHILVIGSQCKALGGDLSFLPKAAEDLYRVMTNPKIGCCVSARGDALGLLIDTSVVETKKAIKEALHEAMKCKATLFLAYVGHGTSNGPNFYLLPIDAAAQKPDSDTGVQIVHVVQEALGSGTGMLDGLLVLIDACDAGEAGIAATSDWVQGLKGALQFEILTSTADRPAIGGCFSKSLVDLLTEGVSEDPSELLHCHSLGPLIGKRCPAQVPQHPSYRYYSPEHSNLALWLGRNASVSIEPWAKTAIAEDIKRHMNSYQATPVLRLVVKRSIAHRCVAVIGEAGAGKSALTAALAWPSKTQGIVPELFAHGVVLLSESTTPQLLSCLLTAQLERSVSGFKQAQDTFAKVTPYAELKLMTTLERHVLGPLKTLAPPSEIRLIIDGLDRLAVGAKSAVMGVLNELRLCTFLHLVVTARPDTELPRDSTFLHLGVAPEVSIHQYLNHRSVAQHRHQDVIDAASGNWLVARIIADILSKQPDAAINAGNMELNDAYEEMLAQCGVGAEDSDGWTLLIILAAAGADAVLPLRLLCAASEVLGGPVDPAHVRNQLVPLRGLVVRASAGTELEHVGLFHPTFVDYIAQVEERLIKAHCALLAGISKLNKRDPQLVNFKNPIQRYAFEREPEHRWALQDYEGTLQTLVKKRSTAPRDNQLHWQAWNDRFLERFGDEHEYTLVVRHHIAFWTSECGEYSESRSLYLQLLDVQTRVLGADHPETLNTLRILAGLTGKSGNPAGALEQLRTLIPTLDRALGENAPYTLRARSDIVGWAGESGYVREALALAQLLFIDQSRVLGPNHPDTLWTRSAMATWLGESGYPHEALEMAREILRARTRVLGAFHRLTLITRHHIAIWTGLCNDARESLRLAKALLTVQNRVLGPSHPDTLANRITITSAIYRCGDIAKALRQAMAIEKDLAQVLGQDHPLSMSNRQNIASWMGQCGHPREGLKLALKVLRDQHRVLRSDHPDSLKNRFTISGLLAQCGKPARALRWAIILLKDQIRVMGSDHPDILITRHAIVLWTCRVESIHIALEQALRLHDDLLRILGPRHSQTLRNQCTIVEFCWAIDKNTGSRIYSTHFASNGDVLIAALERVFGPDDRLTLGTRHFLMEMAIFCGNLIAALRFTPKGL